LKLVTGHSKENRWPSTRKEEQALSDIWLVESILRARKETLDAFLSLRWLLALDSVPALEKETFKDHQARKEIVQPDRSLPSWFVSNSTFAPE
jgi:hypothetical protein